MVMPRSRYEVTIGNAVLLMLNCSTVQSLPMHKTPHLLTETDNCHSSAHVTRAASVSNPPHLMLLHVNHPLFLGFPKYHLPSPIVPKITPCKCQDWMSRPCRGLMLRGYSHLQHKMSGTFICYMPELRQFQQYNFRYQFLFSFSGTETCEFL